MAVYPKFVMVDGPDSAGKSKVLEALKQWAVDRKLKVVDLPGMQKEFHEKKKLDERELRLHTMIDDVPLLRELEQEFGTFDVLMSAEPTQGCLGRLIRNEIIHKDHLRPYTTLATAHAYGLERNIIYNRCLVDVLNRGLYDFHDRGFVTSMVYQTVQGAKEGLTLDDILRIPGNLLAQEYMPGLLILLRITPETASERSKKRTKQDGAIFEKEEFQRKVNEAYGSAWLREFFESRGTTVAYLDMDQLPTPADTARRTVELWDQYLKDRRLA
jgi:thymidylate kinase